MNETGWLVQYMIITEMVRYRLKRTQIWDSKTNYAENSKFKKVFSSEIHEFVIISEIEPNRRIFGITCIFGSKQTKIIEKQCFW